MGNEYVGGTCGSGMSVVHGMTGVGGVYEMCMYLARGGEGG